MIITKGLIQKLKKRDERVFNQIYYAFEGLVYYICYSITLNKEASQDLTQDTFVKLLTSIDSYEENGHFKQYIMQIARNLSKNYVTRVQQKEVTLVSDDLTFDSFASNNKEAEEAKLIIELRGLLSTEEADIVILKIVYDFKFKEIAEDKNMTIGEVQSIYYRALEKVKKAYKEAERI